MKVMIKRTIEKKYYRDFVNFFSKHGGIEKYCLIKYHSACYIKAKFDYQRDMTNVLKDIKKDFSVEYKFVNEEKFYILDYFDFAKLQKKSTLKEIEETLNIEYGYFNYKYRTSGKISYQVMKALIDHKYLSYHDIKKAKEVNYR